MPAKPYKPSKPITFGAGGDKSTLAHELTHVKQQANKK
jgi:hypothetical protein